MLTGECFCGRVKYRLDARPYGARSCHCSMCRKAFSAQASAYALIEPGSLTWLEGENLLTSFIGAHGAGKQFCSVCGSTLCGIVNGEIHGITLGCLNEDPGIEIGMHIFVGSKAPWEVIPDGVVRYEGAPPAEI